MNVNCFQVKENFLEPLLKGNPNFLFASDLELDNSVVWDGVLGFVVLGGVLAEAPLDGDDVQVVFDRTIVLEKDQNAIC